MKTVASRAIIGETQTNEKMAGIDLWPERPFPLGVTW